MADKIIGISFYRHESDYDKNITSMYDTRTI